MTPTQVKRVLKWNKAHGRRPSSLYQVAAIRGCSRSVVTEAMQKPSKSRPLFEWFETHLGPTLAEMEEEKRRTGATGRRSLQRANNGLAPEVSPIVDAPGGE